MELLPTIVQDYLDDHCDPEPAILQSIAHQTHLKVLRPHMISGHYQGRLLSFFSKLIQPKAVLEVGTFTGYATICLAEGLGDNGKIDTIEINPELEDLIKSNFLSAGLQQKIQLHIGEALHIIPLLSKKIYDIAFIDADKRNNYAYFELLINLIRPGGLVLVDNVLRKGKVAYSDNQESDLNVLRTFNQKIKLDQRVESMILPVRDGLMILRKK